MSASELVMGNAVFTKLDSGRGAGNLEIEVSGDPLTEYPCAFTVELTPQQVDSLISWLKR